MNQFGTQQITLFTAATATQQKRPTEEDIQKWQGKLDSYALQLMDTASFQVATQVDYDTKTPVPQRMLNAARRAGAGYIIIANRGHSKLREALLGSTVTVLLQQSNLPVFLIKLREDTAGDSNETRLRCNTSCHDALQHILYPTDFSDTARYAFETLSRMAAGPTERITLFHVQAKGQVDLTNAAQLEEFNRIDRERLQSLSRELQEQARVDVDIALSQGSPAQLIVDKARSVSATMIVMGSQGRGYISDLFLGGVTYNVLRDTLVPVLVIPARNPDNYEHQEKAWMT